MKLSNVLNELNQFEKNSFLKIIMDILSRNTKEQKKIDKLLLDASLLKDVDSDVVSDVFKLVLHEFEKLIVEKMEDSNTQLDVLIDIITRDGNSMMSREWFAQLYEKEIKTLKKKIKEFNTSLDNNSFEVSRCRDYTIYRECVRTAHFNDVSHNLEAKITHDENSILNTLSSTLALSQEEIKLINYNITGLVKKEVDEVINELKLFGILFYSKRQHKIFVPDEMVMLLRKVRGKHVADKYFRRVLRLLKEPTINHVCRIHNVNWKDDLNTKISNLLNCGISFRSLLIDDIHKADSKLNDRKKFLNELVDKGLGITPILKGTTIEEKVDNLILYFDELENDSKVSIGMEGYNAMLIDLGENIKGLNILIKQAFELQDDDVLKGDFLLDYNIKPRDVLELVDVKDLDDYCKVKGFKVRGNSILNILEAFKDSDNLLFENYVSIAKRDLNQLKENGIKIKEADLGNKFEEITKSIFVQLGLNVDEATRKGINTSKDKMDILLRVSDKEVMIVECKSIKEKGYNKFSSVSRQVGSYIALAKKNDFTVIKSLIVAPDFSDDFVQDCELDVDLNISLIKAESLVKILKAFNESKRKEFPYNLLRRDVLIQEDRIIKAILK